MMRLSAIFALCAATAGAQTARPSFDLASVQVSPRSAWVKNGPNSLRGGFLAGDRYEVHRATILDLIRLAYNVEADRIYGGPSWLDYDKFDVVAKTKPGTRPEVLLPMLQALLADRFGLSVKPDTQPVPAYVLSAGKDRSKLKPAESAASGGCTTVAGPRTPSSAGLSIPIIELRCQGVTMDEFVAGLRRLAGPFFKGGLPVINLSGIDGSWDIDIKYAQIATRTSPTGEETLNGNAIFEAIDKQLGMKLVIGEAPQEVLSVVNVKRPTPDAEGIAAALPPLPPPQFEVAVVRSCGPNGAPGRTQRPRIEPGGRVTATCYPLLGILWEALNLAPGEEVPGLPKFLDGNNPTDIVSIDARAPAGSIPNNADIAQTRDVLESMLKAILVDRFKLAYHYEERPVDAFTLAAAKPKLTKADPSGRTGCTSFNHNGVKVTCKNITMAQFAEQIPAFYATARYPVLDATHLEGAWDFTLEYNPAAAFQTRRVAIDAAGATPEAGAPTGPTSLAEAMEKQTGLKLETHKRPEPVLVIDHMEENPTDN